MVRARLTAIDGRAVGPQDFADKRAKRLVGREFNLSWTGQVAADNRVIRGAWWTPAEFGSPLFSVEEGIAKTLSIRLGDRLTYRIAGQALTGTVVNLRAVSWDSFRVNFFVVTPPGVLEQHPQTYITSFYLPQERRQLLNGLVREFPNITVIDVDALMTQVRSIMGRVTRALEYVFLFTLGAGIVVLYTAIQTTHDERLQESILLRTLGARRRQMIMGWTTEFAVLGLLAGALAALAASLLAYMLATQVFDLPYRPNPGLFLWGALAGTLGAAMAGFLGMRVLLRRPPLETLRAL
jgi:putative ABC transport system permease protein